ncbi:hypothetical protein E4U42_004801 [Claviceps africana]|uniref:Xylanolytic transcriptional activator regulatory domain-containing protein n=1 Tax=Claviceps africana TaxID=83212 RepID=A0A8K0J553_9HYPO|nr:hypothetical protein E4U42_004801 [Claviceps africana]
MGPSQFSHNERSEKMLEKELPRPKDSESLCINADLDRETKLVYSQCFHAVTQGFIDVFDASEAEEYLMLSDGNTCSRQKRAVFGMVVAIGAQCKSASSAQDIARSYFRRAQSDAFVDMLEDPDIDVVRLFVLMAFYLLGECRRNTAFMYLGIATRAAVALGLHSRESYHDLDAATQSLRLRIWFSLCVIDMLVNSILGRPAATAGLTSDMDTLIEDLSPTETSDGMACLIASHEIVCIINKAVDTIYGRKEISNSVVESLLNDIEMWSQTLPACLKAPGGDIGNLGSQYANEAIGAVHVSCLYYFAITLVTRPIFMSSLTASTASEEPAQSELASACLDAAAYLVQTCVDAKRMGLLYGNMCIMKALVFAAGLVLGFEVFAKRSIEYDVETAFVGARDVLHFLSLQSPQAGHYYEILTLLSNEIAKQRQNVAVTGRSRYVSKIFTLREENELPPEERHGDKFMSTQVEDGGSWLDGSRTPTGEEQEGFLGWDSFDIWQWDNFPFVS